jgi:hypothetical protein
MAEQMWMIPAQQPSLHEDSARLLPRLGARCLPGSADRGRRVASRDRADPRPAGRRVCRTRRKDRGRGAHGADHPRQRPWRNRSGAFSTGWGGAGKRAFSAEKPSVFIRSEKNVPVSDPACDQGVDLCPVFDQSQTSRQRTGASRVARRARVAGIEVVLRPRREGPPHGPRAALSRRRGFPPAHAGSARRAPPQARQKRGHPAEFAASRHLRHRSSAHRPASVPRGTGAWTTGAPPACGEAPARARGRGRTAPPPRRPCSRSSCRRN